MLTSKVAKRYAQGLLEFAKESNTSEVLYHEMKDVVKVMDESQELNRFFLAPFIDANKKMEVAKEVFKAFSATTQNLVQLVIKNGREAQLKGIAAAYIAKIDELSGIQKVTLTTAVPLSDASIQTILKSSSLVNPNSKFDLNVVVDANILGGYILRVGDEQIDASVKTKLDNVRKSFELN